MLWRGISLSRRCVGRELARRGDCVHTEERQAVVNRVLFDRTCRERDAIGFVVRVGKEGDAESAGHTGLIGAARGRYTATVSTCSAGA